MKFRGELKSASHGPCALLCDSGGGVQYYGWQPNYYHGANSQREGTAVGRAGVAHTVEQNQPGPMLAQLPSDPASSSCHPSIAQSSIRHHGAARDDSEAHLLATRARSLVALVTTPPPMPN